jgi:uncharacterized membrane protein
MSSLPLALGIGFVSGLRSFTGLAAVSWAACYGRLDLRGTSLQFIGSGAAVVISSLLAMAEYVADKLPRTPNRINRGPLIGRIFLGGLSGAALTLSAQDSLVAGALLGAVGAVIGAFSGYEVRKRLVRELDVRDTAVAISEDLIAIGLAYLIVVSS